MRIAITGSSGLIGTALTRSLETDGHTVVPVVRSDPGPGEVAWDIPRQLIDTDGLEGLDGVVHLAGAGIGDKRWNEARKAEILDSRRDGTSLLAGALASLDKPPAVLVSGSAVGFYGDRGDEQLTEASGPGEGFLPELVQIWEASAAPAVAAGIRVAYLRSGVVFAGHGGALARMASIARFGLLGRLGTGRQWMSWITLADEVGVIRFLLEHDVAGPVNATSPVPVTNAVLTKALGRVLRRPTFLPVPAFGPRLVLGRELADVLLFEGQRVLPDVLLDAGYAFEHPELEPALRAVLDR